jgi:hypothetical protein
MTEKIARIGTVSEGTMRNEDLIPALTLPRFAILARIRAMDQTMAFGLISKGLILTLTESRLLIWLKFRCITADSLFTQTTMAILRYTMCATDKRKKSGRLFERCYKALHE